MWQDIQAFLKALLRHWKATLTGSAPIAVITVVEYSGYPVPSFVKLWIVPLLLLAAAFVVWRQERAELATLKEKLSSFPRLWIDDVQVGEMWSDYKDGIFTAQGPKNSVIWLHLKNEPLNNTADSIAEGVRASVKFYDAAGTKLFEMRGRWSHTVQPPFRNPNDDPSRFLATAFAVGERRTVDIAFKQKARGDCYGFNDESYVENYANPAWKLPTGTIVAYVELVGIRVKCRVRLQFYNPEGPGELKALEYSIENQF
jgi:hypothetical protein